MIVFINSGSLAAAIADYEKSIDAGASADGCSLFGLYTQDRQYDQAGSRPQGAELGLQKIPGCLTFHRCDFNEF